MLLQKIRYSLQPSEKQRRTFRASVPLELVIVAVNGEQRDAWMHAIRLRLAPWQLLEKRMYEVKSSLPHDFPLQRLSSEVTSVAALVLSSPSDAASDGTGPYKERNRQDSWKKVEVVADTARIVPDLVMTVTLATRRFFNESVLENADQAANTAAYVADVTKGVSGVGSAFQAVALVLRLIDMASEAKRGREVMPRLRSKLRQHLTAIAESMTLLLHPKSNVHQLLVANVFQVQEKSLRIVGDIEQQMMRSSMSQFFNANAVKKLESAIGVLHTGEISKLQTESKLQVPQLCTRPKVTPFFVGPS